MASWFPPTLERYRAEHERHLQHVAPLDLASRLQELSRQFLAVLRGGQRDERAYLDIAGETLALAGAATLRYAPHTPDARGVITGRVALAVRQADELERRGDPLTLAAAEAVAGAAAYAATLIGALDRKEAADRATALSDLQRWLAQLATIALAVARDAGSAGAGDQTIPSSRVHAQLDALSVEIRARAAGEQLTSPLSSIIVSTQPELDILREALGDVEPRRTERLRHSRASWIRAADDWDRLARDLATPDSPDPLDLAAAQAAQRILASRLAGDVARVDLEELWSEQTLRLALLIDNYLDPAADRTPGRSEAIQQLASLLIALWAIDRLTGEQAGLPPRP